MGRDKGRVWQTISGVAGVLFFFIVICQCHNDLGFPTDYFPFCVLPIIRPCLILSLGRMLGKRSRFPTRIPSTALSHLGARRRRRRSERASGQDHYSSGLRDYSRNKDSLLYLSSAIAVLCISLAGARRGDGQLGTDLTFPHELFQLAFFLSFLFTLT